MDDYEEKLNKIPALDLGNPVIENAPVKKRRVIRMCRITENNCIKCRCCLLDYEIKHFGRKCADCAIADTIAEIDESIAIRAANKK